MGRTSFHFDPNQTSHGHETGNDLTITLLVALCPNAPYFIILLCLMPDDFTCQGESAATQWVNLPMHLVHLLTGNAPLLYCFTLSNAR
jgi:hypothetical protein